VLHIYCLGELQLTHDNSLLPRLATQKAASLLAYLILHPGRSHPREALAEMLWPNRPSQNARRSLHTALWQIRRSLKRAGLEPDDFFFATDQAVGWHAPASRVWLDVHDFEAGADSTEIESLQRAVALARGEFLEGLHDDWCLEERYRLQEKLLQALGRLSEHCLADHCFADALAYARRILQIDNLREEAYRAAMLALYQLGERSAALEQFAACARVLRAELGVEPSSATRALQQAIAGETLPRVAGSPSLVRAAEVEPSPRALYDPQQIPFTGRDVELRQLSDWWQAGRVPLLLIRGEAGVGKTRLAQEWSAALGYGGTRVCLGRSYAFERLLPYQAIAEAVRELLVAAPEAALSALPGWVSAQLARLLPEITERVPHAAPPGDQGQSQLFNAVARGIAHLAADGLALFVIHDLQWAGESTVALLEYLVRQRLGRNVRWLATAREEDLPGSEAGAALERLRREGLVLDLPLPRLDAAQVTAWIGQWSGLGERASSFAARLHRDTQGNPFFIAKTIEALFEAHALWDGGRGWEGAVLLSGGLPFPGTARELIEARLRRLPARSLEAIRVAAVLGKEFDLSVLRGAWGVAEEKALDALDDLLRAQLVQESATPGGRDYEFSHDKIQETVYAGLPRARRAALHRRAGAAIEAEYGTAAAAELAHHYGRSNQWPLAIQWAVRAGDRALELPAYGDARGFLEQARAQLERLEAGAVTVPVQMALSAGLCSVYWSLRSATLLMPAAEKLLSLAQAAGDARCQVEALWRLGQGMGLAKDARCQATFEQARALAEQSQSPRLPDLLHALAMYEGWSENRWELTLQRLAEALAAAERTGVRYSVGIAVGTARMFTGDLGGSLAAYQQAIIEKEELGDLAGAAVGQANLAEDYLLLHLPERARQPLARAREMTEALGRQDADVYRCLGWMHHLAGQQGPAREWLQRALDLARETAHVHYLREVFHNYCALLIDCGEPDRALGLAQELCANPAFDWGPTDLLPSYTRGLAWLALNRLDQAEADLISAVQRGERTRTSPRLWAVYATLSRLHARQGRTEAAMAATGRAEQLVASLAQSLAPFADVRQEFLGAVLPLIEYPRR
jgi:DNA-binding SARP family transcriptional activator